MLNTTEATKAHGSINPETKQAESCILKILDARLEACRKVESYSEMDEAPIKNSLHALLAATRWLISNTINIEITPNQTKAQLKDQHSKELSKMGIILYGNEISVTQYQAHWSQEWGTVISENIDVDRVIDARMMALGFRYCTQKGTYIKHAEQEQPG